MSNKLFRKIQIGSEVTAGTAVAATAVYRGMGVPNNPTEPAFPEEHVGRARTNRSYIPSVEALLEMPDHEATFEQLGYILGSGIKDASGVQDGVGSDYIYTYSFPDTAANTIKTRTLEGGNDQQAREMAYSFVEEFTLKGKFREAVMLGAKWRGRQWSNVSFTGALSLPTVEEILVQKGKLYIDAAGGAIGATQISNTLYSFELPIKTGWQPKFTGDGNLYFSFAAWAAAVMDLELKLTFEYNGTAVTEEGNKDSETARLLRLLFEGSTVGTPGTTYSKKSLIVDLPGKWSKFDPIDEQDGNDIVTATFRPAYDETAALAPSIVVVNELSALP